MDIVVKIDGKEVTSIEAVRALHKDTVADVKSKHRIVFTVLRSGLLRQVVLDFSRDYSKE
jgi:S1-C subfamily serine protease